MTSDQKIAVFGNEFEASPEIKAIRPYQEQIRKMGGYSTAPKPGVTSENNAYLNKIDFPSVSIYGITGKNTNTKIKYRGTCQKKHVYEPKKIVFPVFVKHRTFN
jgi:hypothetical protein